jgi:hypothetical protein
MSVTEVKTASTGVGGEVSGNDSGSISVTYRSSYWVKCSSAADTQDTVLRYFMQNADYPWPGRPFKFGNDFNTNMFTRTVNANYIENSDGKFRVDCTFQSLQGGDQQQQGQTPSGNNSTNPLQWHDEIHVSFTQISIPVESAIFKGFTKLGVNNKSFKQGKEMAIMNSACKPFDPTIEDEIDIKVIRMTRNVEAYDDTQLTQYQGAINSDVVTINKPNYKFKTSFGLYHGRIKSLTADFQITNGIPYYKHGIEIHVYPPGKYGWLRLLLDQGFEELYREGDKRPDGQTVSISELPSNRPFEVKTITDEEGLPVTSPVRLDGNGKMLKPEDDPVYLIYQTRKLLPFSSIPF